MNYFLSIIYIVCLELYDRPYELLPGAVRTEKKLLGSVEFMVWFHSDTVACYHTYYQKFIVKD